MPAVAAIVGVAAACTPRESTRDTERTVTVYVSTDRVCSEPVLREYERRSGVTVNAVYDTEETKSTGLANRLLAEQARPQADVFWSNEPVRTLVLKSRGAHDREEAHQLGDRTLEMRSGRLIPSASADDV